MPKAGAKEIKAWKAAYVILPVAVILTILFAPVFRGVKKPLPPGMAWGRIFRFCELFLWDSWKKPNRKGE